MRKNPQNQKMRISQKKVRKNTNTQSGVGAGPAPPAPTSSSSDKIYPELRKVESKRFAIKLKDSLYRICGLYCLKVKGILFVIKSLKESK